MGSPACWWGSVGVAEGCSAEHREKPTRRLETGVQPAGQGQCSLEQFFFFFFHLCDYFT